ncbi:MAG TPA: RagB/SusD family nutrient uptake outer membrane protein, partial [Agriterribacter sp.]|nr:RagB/SusD family nutrient uptake outer membrane protein [Agriterribacter sp.]
MQKLIYLFIATLVLITSCKKFLDRPPLDTITDKEMKFSKKEMELYANQYYVNFPQFLDAFYADNSSDNMVYGSFDYNPLLAGTVTVPNSGGGWSWANIRSVNYFLANYQLTTESLSDVGTYIGEVYFWRAWFYFNLMKRFGDLPWYNTPLGTNSEELYAPRVSRSIIADSILSDLDRAINLLAPVTQSIPQRIHKDVAVAFKARVALYEGSWEKYHEGTPFGVPNANYNKYFQIAADAAETLINSGYYNIPIGSDPQWDYWSLFNQRDLSGNREVIFWRKYDLSQGLTHNGQAMLLLEGGNTGLSKQLVDDYLCQDGLPVSLSPLYLGDDSIARVITNRDPRLSQTIYVRGYA